jgi:hypothetical protein
MYTARERALIEYRADPNDYNFSKVASLYEPWIRRTGAETFARFSHLVPVADEDDLRVEALFCFARSARRFVYVCPVCNATFLERRDFRTHATVEHFILAPEELIKITTFCEVGARLAMRRAARRLIRPEEILVEELPEMSCDGSEERLIILDLVKRAESRLSGEALALLVRMISGDVPRKATRGRCAVRLPNVARVMSQFILHTPEVKEILMENTLISDKGPRWKVLSLQTLRESAHGILGLDVTERTVRGAYEEVLRKLEGRELDYVCGRCNAPLDDKMTRCWACGAVISDDEEEPEMKLEEVQTRARSLGIALVKDGNRKNKDELLKEVEAAEHRRRLAAARGADVHGLEAQKLNEALTVKVGLPDGWTKSVSKQFTSYWDADHVRRISVALTGFRVCFCVPDAFFGEEKDHPEGLNFYDQAERKRRHYGRDNYIYRGDVSKVALQLAEKVFSLGKRSAKKGKR